MTTLFTACREWSRSCTSAVARRLALLALVMVALCGASPAFAQKPTVDGNLTDFFNYAFSTAACGDTINDPARDVAVFDPAFPDPCPPHAATPFYFQNGFDETMYGFARARDGSNDLFLAMRVAGVIGDTDGNGDPSSACGGSCDLACKQTDDPNIGSNERYKWLFDTDCDPADTRPVDLEIEVIGNAVGIYAVNNSGVRAPVAGASGTFAFNGANLEVKVSGLSSSVLGPAFRVTNATAGSDPDGLSEDGSTESFCQPNPQIHLEKSATPIAICVGEKTRFTLTVSNPGDVTQSVVLVDVLPAGLAYAGNPGSTCGVGAPSESPTGTLTWPAFDLAAGASCDISFDAQAAAECFGVVTNNATATGTFQAGCFNGGQAFQSFDKASFQVTCKAKPCVELTADRNPASACPGDAVSIFGTVRNCSVAAENIVVTVNGQQAFNQSVGAGQTVQWNFPTTMPACTAGQSVTWNVQATATTDCPPADVKNAQVSVLCKQPPCVDVTAGANKTAACPNEEVIISGKVKNCGGDTANYTVTVGGVQVFSGSLAAGAEADYQRTVSMGECTAGNNVSWTVHAVASNSCGEDTEDKTVNVRCKDKPCVELTANRDPAEACPGNPVTISGTVKNCSLDPEVITVTVNGEQVFNETVQPGVTRPYSKATVMPACTAGQNVNWTVVATASGDCPPNDTKQQVVSVLCKNPPCANIVPNPVEPACKGATLHLTGKVVNCGQDTENIVVKYGATTVQTCNGVAPGGECAFDLEVTMPECTDGTVPFKVDVTATNSCGEDTKSYTFNVPCQRPQIDVEKSALEASVNNGGTIHYTITVTNPSATVGLEDIVITDQLCNYVRYANNATPAPFSAPAVGSPGSVVWHLATLAPGASAEFKFEVTADVTLGGATCPTTVNCPNVVDVIGYCVGSNHGSSATDRDDVTTPITCAVASCPRTPGFWWQQCLQRGNGSTKFTRAQMDAITAKVDDVSSFFNWTNDFDQFCATISTSDMNQRKQAKRQFATFLANYATDLLNYTPSNGGKLTLDPNTPVSCSGFTATNVAQLIPEVDALLASLEGQSLNDGTVKSKYGQIISCLDDINNGRTIPTTDGCEHSSTLPTSGDQVGDVAAPSVDLYRAVPNPFSSTTQFTYEVTAETGSNVDISVFDVAGRQVKKLVSSFQPGGRYTATWDGRSDAGMKVSRGVYFVRTVISGQKAPVQRLILVNDAQ